MRNVYQKKYDNLNTNDASPYIFWIDFIWSHLDVDKQGNDKTHYLVPIWSATSSQGEHRQYDLSCWDILIDMDTSCCGLY